MKTKFLLLMFLFFSVCVSAQDGMKAFTSQDSNTSSEEFIKNNKTNNVINKSSEVITVEVDGSTIDEDYTKITWVFISGKIMNCVVEFKENQTFESLCKKYGTGSKTDGGYEWYDSNKTINIIFNYSTPKEVMIIYGVRQYAYQPGK